MRKMRFILIANSGQTSAPSARCPSVRFAPAAMLATIPWSEILILCGRPAGRRGASGILAGLLGVGGGGIIVPVLYEVFRIIGVSDDVRMQLVHRHIPRHHRPHVHPLLPGPQGPRTGGAGPAEGARPAGRHRGGAGQRHRRHGQRQDTSGRLHRPLGGARRPQHLRPHRLAARRSTARKGHAQDLGLLHRHGLLDGRHCRRRALHHPAHALYGVPIHAAVATSAGVGIFIPLPGVLGYAISGWPHLSDLPPLSLAMSL